MATKEPPDRALKDIAKTLNRLAKTTRLMAEAISDQTVKLAEIEAYITAQPWYDQEQFEIVQRGMQKEISRVVDPGKRGAKKKKGDVEKAIEFLKSFDGPKQ